MRKILFALSLLLLITFFRPTISNAASTCNFVEEFNYLGGAGNSPYAGDPNTVFYFTGKIKDCNKNDLPPGIALKVTLENISSGSRIDFPFGVDENGSFTTFDVKRTIPVGEWKVLMFRNDSEMTIYGGSHSNVTVRDPSQQLPCRSSLGSNPPYSNSMCDPSCPPQPDRFGRWFCGSIDPVVSSPDACISSLSISHCPKNAQNVDNAQPCTITQSTDPKNIQYGSRYKCQDENKILCYEEKPIPAGSNSIVTPKEYFCVDLPPVPSPPCAEYVPNQMKCLRVSTAIGDIQVEPEKFIGNIFSIILGFAGIAAFIMIVISGYTLIMSAGDKEKVQGARETLISAISGLLFIIFSLAILEFIGIDILRIPGLGP